MHYALSMLNVHIISHLICVHRHIAGQVLHVIKHDKLPKNPGQISIRDGVIAIPTYEKGTVSLFKLVR